MSDASDLKEQTDKLLDEVKGTAEALDKIGERARREMHSVLWAQFAAAAMQVTSGFDVWSMARNSAVYADEMLAEWKKRWEPTDV